MGAIILTVHGCHHLNFHQHLTGRYFCHGFDFKKPLISIMVQIFFILTRKKHTVKPVLSKHLGESKKVVA